MVDLIVLGVVVTPTGARGVTPPPARTFNIFPRKGQIAVGSDADLVVLDPNASWTLRAEALHSSAGWTPHEGTAMRGRVRTTLVRGQVVYDAGRVHAAPGFGTFIRP